jgi:hypothetical protein
MRAQKESHPKETGEHCTEIELGCVSILESFSGSLCSQREQFYTVHQTRFANCRKQNEVSEIKENSTLPSLKNSHREKNDKKVGDAR